MRLTSLPSNVALPPAAPWLAEPHDRFPDLASLLVPRTPNVLS